MMFLLLYPFASFFYFTPIFTRILFQECDISQRARQDLNNKIHLNIKIQPRQSLTSSIQLLSLHQAFFTPVFTFAGFCMALYKHWKKFIPLLAATVTNTAIISRRHFCDIELERFNRKTLQFIHYVVGSVSGCEVISLQKVDSLL